MHPRVQLLLRHVLPQAPATSPKICGGQPAQLTFFSLSLFLSPKRRFPRTNSLQQHSPKTQLCFAEPTSLYSLLGRSNPGASWGSPPTLDVRIPPPWLGATHRSAAAPGSAARGRVPKLLATKTCPWCAGWNRGNLVAS